MYSYQIKQQLDSILVMTCLVFPFDGGGAMIAAGQGNCGLRYSIPGTRERMSGIRVGKI
ncbi:hypothetical protein BDV34DRAFT_202703 [Aspergillus parasiticus]|uniref:Uncharacterized protein n=1 Tax=Aspergillus parasiticus TaxID=5067 RepID=A0A5N6D8K5_ASPPA|nr:hypothetical protein BDV34DRAFT_202703 [Aspergillus parasiticus]